uniref:SFRICE_025678 n=1 Tax=Spodoptera frugiperda TaxID=7108 RepID=A0A2H1WUJ6_SPOFR
MRSDVLAPSELEGTDYLLSSTMRLEDSFLQILGEYQIKQININTSSLELDTGYLPFFLNLMSMSFCYLGTVASAMITDELMTD